MKIDRKLQDVQLRISDLLNIVKESQTGDHKAYEIMVELIDIDHAIKRTILKYYDEYEEISPDIAYIKD